MYVEDHITHTLIYPKIFNALDKEPLIVSPDCLLKDVILQMRQEKPKSYVLVRDQKSKFIQGIFTERDRVKLAIKKQKIDDLLIKDVMTTSMITLSITEDTGLLTALKILQQNSIRHLPTVDLQGNLLGVLV